MERIQFISQGRWSTFAPENPDIHNVIVRYAALYDFEPRTVFGEDAFEPIITLNKRAFSNVAKGQLSQNWRVFIALLFTSIHFTSDEALEFGLRLLGKDLSARGMSILHSS